MSLPSDRCLVAVDKSEPGVWRCVDGHLHVDVKTCLEVRGLEASQENMDMLSAALADQYSIVKC